MTIQKYRFKRLLTRYPSETSSLEYIIITNYTVSFFYYTNTEFFITDSFSSVIDDIFFKNTL